MLSGKINEALLVKNYQKLKKIIFGPKRPKKTQKIPKKE